jgi:hypothetical protein
VLAPLAVCAGVKVPQVPEGEQVQSTPAFAVSLVTAALSVVAPPTTTLAGGGVVNEIPTLVDAAEIVTVATAVVEWLVVDAAVIVTLPPEGAVAGAV